MWDFIIAPSYVYTIYFGHIDSSTILLSFPLSPLFLDTLLFLSSPPSIFMVLMLLLF